MITPKNLEDINRLISDKIEENRNLEYKGADALNDKKEIAKDVSAMANSDGGVIVYGIKEFDDKKKNHLPEKITPINRKDFSKERLEDIILGNVSPKLESLKIIPISINDTEVVYVAEVQQSNTAHQNTIDKKYYKRDNFKNEPMLDYQIRDIMNRNKNPIVNLDFEFSIELDEYTFNDGVKSLEDAVKLRIYLVNNGKVMAKYINYYVKIPYDIIKSEDFEDKLEEEYYGDNMIAGNFVPILPGIRKYSQKIDIDDDFIKDDRQITWTIYADNAISKWGSIKLKDIKLINNLYPDN